MRLIYFISLFIVPFIFSCSQDYIPKPMGYFRIDLPEKKYQKFESDCPFTFEYPVYARVVKSNLANAEPCWFNIEFPQFNAKVHLSYKNVAGNINDIIEECRTLAYKHSIKADAIDERPYDDPENKVFGMLYEIKGNAASSVQFYTSDSAKHFLRGSLYFEVRPNKDSLAPVIDFIEQDIVRIIESLRWK